MIKILRKNPENPKKKLTKSEKTEDTRFENWISLLVKK